MATKELRAKLSDKQYALLIEANTRLRDAYKVVEQADLYLKTISALILDAKGLPETMSPRIDESSKELVWVEEVAETHQTDKE